MERRNSYRVCDCCRTLARHDRNDPRVCEDCAKTVTPDPGPNAWDVPTLELSR